MERTIFTDKILMEHDCRDPNWTDYYLLVYKVGFIGHLVRGATKSLTLDE